MTTVEYQRGSDNIKDAIQTICTLHGLTEPVEAFNAALGKTNSQNV